MALPSLRISGYVFHLGFFDDMGACAVGGGLEVFDQFLEALVAEFPGVAAASSPRCPCGYASLLFW
jgi:hypothetical protein